MGGVDRLQILASSAFGFASRVWVARRVTEDAKQIRREMQKPKRTRAGVAASFHRHPLQGVYLKPGDFQLRGSCGLSLNSGPADLPGDCVCLQDDLSAFVPDPLLALRQAIGARRRKYKIQRICMGYTALRLDSRPGAKSRKPWGNYPCTAHFIEQTTFGRFFASRSAFRFVAIVCPARDCWNGLERSSHHF